MRRTKEEAALTRDRLLQAAQISFLSKGYAATTLEDIAQQAGITRGAIQWHFGNKAALFNTLVRDRYERAVNVLREISAQDGTSLQRLRQILVWWLSYPEEDSDFRAILELTMLKVEVGPELAEGMQEKIQGHQHTQRWFIALIQQGIASGEIRPEVNPEVAARAALGMVHGVTSTWLMDSAAFSLKATAEETVDLFLQGITQR